MNVHLTLSILIPVYKGSGTLTTALGSILHQSDTPDEVIIGDDTSSKDVIEIKKIKQIIEQFKKKAPFPVLYLHNNKNLGCQKNFQNLTDLATKDIVLYLAHDDIFSSNAIKIVKDVFQKNPKVGFMTRPYFWFYDDIKKPIRYVPPPDDEKHTIIPSVDDLLKRDNDVSQKAVSEIFGSIGQISGLVLRRKWITEPFHEDIFPGHMYPIADMWKKHQGIFIKDYILAVGTATSQSRTISGIYEDSPTEQWMRMFRYNFNGKKYSQILKLCTKHIATNYLGLIQIKNFSTTANVFDEIVILLKYRTINIFSFSFWFYSMLSLVIPKTILLRCTDWYKNTIMSKSIPQIEFDYSYEKSN